MKVLVFCPSREQLVANREASRLICVEHVYATSSPVSNLCVYMLYVYMCV